MFTAFYLYRVPRNRVERFLEIERQAGEIYLEYGAVAVSIMRVTDGAARYGCTGLCERIQAEEGEELFVGVDTFRNAAQSVLLMKRIDSDPRIDDLYRAMRETVDLGKVIRWEAADDEYSNS